MSEISNFIQKLNASKLSSFLDPTHTNFHSHAIDKKIRKTLQQINNSSWCWTLFSCQGHKHKNGVITLPYFVFVVRNSKISEFFKIIYDTIPKPKECALPLMGYNYSITVGFSDENFSIISVYWDGHFVENRGTLNQLHENLNKMSNAIMEHV